METKKETGGELATLLSYGITDNVDAVLGMPYQWKRQKNRTVLLPPIPPNRETGYPDMSLEGKWRFYEKGWA